MTLSRERVNLVQTLQSLRIFFGNNELNKTSFYFWFKYCTVYSSMETPIYSLCLVVQRIISELPSSSFFRPTRASSSPSPSAIRTTQAGQNISTRYQYGTGTVSTNAT